MTLPTQLVLRALLENPTEELYGLQVSSRAELPSGTIHPILARLESVGWLESRWEDADPHEQGRPRRRYYRLSSDGVIQARDALARATAGRSALRSLRPGLAGGSGA
ncbi:PadR family transcriptional regulator [Streptomyces sp. SL13]|uniref:PadR family transcriptional regulator n=1 Tax=Streptantibioticus silvisoli TaxID=2705255 RepID=A0AA90H0N4_9ACTN|nr:PadR family transcriptional regulator [Streptantibioticus silvisoli]MDI5971853.1 PadR family transcriptional regulator [Streptantibioticus silvisoli]